MSSIRVADRYALDREIGRGGSGAVWLARDEVLGRLVALKRIGLPPGASASELARAEREARLAARVNHPNVISVFDFVHEGDQHWLVTEYVEGTTLAQTIRERGRLSPDEAAPLLLQAAEALAAAHQMNIVHRDVKPSNILIGLDGRVLLSDFGIARGIADASLTQTGLVTGSPAYLAPEIATGASATTASDVWSFGTTIYHALAGRPPYEVSGDGAAVLAVLYRIANDPPPRLQGAGWLTPLLEATMEKDPRHRPSMNDVVAHLRAGPQTAPVIGTQVLPASAVPDATPTASMTMPPPAAGAPSRAPAGAPARRNTGRVALAALAALAVLAVVGGLLLVLDDDDPSEALPNNASGETSDTGDGDGQGDGDGDGQGSDPPATPTAEELEEFAASYVETASSDPEAGFQMLTPDYQARSPAYLDFWGSVSNPEILDISADPEALTVTYTYKYDVEGSGNMTELVTLHLVQEGDQLLIDDDS